MSQHNHTFENIVIILGLPRSGTTLAAALFDAHDKTAVCYEPWNRTKKVGLSPNLSPHELLSHFKQDIKKNATTFVLKETSVHINALRWVSKFIAHNSADHNIKIVWTIRKFSHSYLSLIERGREWWGNTHMDVNLGTYNRWIRRTFRSVELLTKLFRNNSGIVYSYEALVENPARIVNKIMTSCELQFDEKLLDFHKLIPRKHIRGDRNIQTGKSGISSHSVKERDEEWNRYRESLSSAKMDIIMTYLNGLSEAVHKKECIDNYDDYNQLAASILTNLNSQALQYELTRLLNKETCIVVVVYKMTRQAMNTIYSLSCSYQQDVNEDDYDIVVVENDSGSNLDKKQVEQLGCNIQYILRDEQHPTPIFAIEEGIQQSYSNSITIMIDGARMVSPGAVRATLDGITINKNAIISVPGYHIGKEPQQQAVKSGYSEQVEIGLLDSINWRENGYDLFSIACLGGSLAEHGLLNKIPESNFLTLPRSLYVDIGGYDKSFISHGGGYANLDFFKRVCENARGPVFLTLTEGTFHQYHGGATTGGDSGERQALMDTLTRQYRKLRGEDFQAPEIEFNLLGKFNHQASEFVIYSIEKLRQAKAQ